jgi:hypothetical protein
MTIGTQKHKIVWIRLPRVILMGKRQLVMTLNDACRLHPQQSEEIGIASSTTEPMFLTHSLKL